MRPKFIDFNNTVDSKVNMTMSRISGLHYNVPEIERMRLSIQATCSIYLAREDCRKLGENGRYPKRVATCMKKINHPKHSRNTRHVAPKK